MRKSADVEKYRVSPPGFESDESYGMNGCFSVRKDGVIFGIIASDQLGWEHVSVSILSKKARLPTYTEMDYIKRLFWEPDEVVVQYHVAEKNHINVHNHVLHLWKPVGREYPVPPKEMV